MTQYITELQQQLQASWATLEARGGGLTSLCRFSSPAPGDERGGSSSGPGSAAEGLPAVLAAVTAAASGALGAAWAALAAGCWRLLELGGALYLSMRYFTGPTCWLLFGYIFYSEPVLRLPLLLYHLWIISPAGRRAVAYSRVPWLLRRCPLYWGQASYFKGSELVKTADLDPSKRYVFAGHPHGLLGNAFFLAFCTNQLGFDEKFPGIRLSIGVLDLNLRVSFCREICLLHGLCDVDRSTLLARLRAGPGSAVFLARGCLDLVLKRRRGFVKVALEAGAELVPVIAFGENDQFNRMDLRPGSLLDLVQKTFKKLTGFAMPLQDALTGAGIMNLPYGPFPLARPPDHCGDLRSEAGRAHVDACHALYCAALQQLYDEHKDKYAPNRIQDMRFVE
ncbi:hypothetical protein COHA_004410 [Chlorella ohadii]|uniref:Acyltransferase n=1 Tax=Chlorella ohadii TaxID=2649997 RepID=A0AAD5H2W0_9CHLO|nr:hypothetical protein COHA_004410 [Chlorella ohadii]